MSDPSDLTQQLSGYIDAIAEPVTVEEVTGTGRLAPQRQVRRRRPLVAVLAGAAVVLLPALVLAAVRWLPSDETTDPTTSLPPTSVATMVVVPDVVGRTVVDAVATIEASGLEASVMGEGSLDAVVVAQAPVSGSEVARGDRVTLEVAGASSNCLDGYAPSLPPPGEGQVDVTVLFDCGDGSEFPNPEPTVRRVDASAEPATAILEAVLAGPSADEITAGFRSFFSSASAGALNSLSVTDGVAVVDFNEAVVVNNASTSTGSMFFLAELNANLFRLDDIFQIDYRIEGSCEAFWNWLQRDCEIVDRGNWEYQVAQWEELRPNGTTVITPIPREGLPDGLITVRYAADAERIVWLPEDELATGDFAPREIVRFESAFAPPRIVASDLMGGVVYETAGRLRWLRAGADEAVDVTSFPEDGHRFTVVDAAAAEPGVGTPVLIVSDWEGTDVQAIDLGTLEPVDAGQVRQRLRDELPFSIDLVEATTRVPGVDEYYDDAYPTSLVVTRRGGGEVARFRVSADTEPYVTLHAFDGRRVLLSRYPYEPALPPETYVLIDLQCGWECTRFFYSGGTTSMSLARSAAPATSVGGGWPADGFPSCSAEGPRDEVFGYDPEFVPEAVAETRRILASLAVRCMMSSIDGLALESGTAIAASHLDYGPRPIETLESYRLTGMGAAATAELLAALTAASFETYTAQDGLEVWVWPGAASPDTDWSALTDVGVDEYAAVFGDQIVDESVALGYWAGWWVEIDETGRWRFFGRNLS